MLKLLLIAFAISISPGCSILFDADSEEPTVHDFTNGFGPWTQEAGCERTVDEADNAIICCTASGGGTRSWTALAIGDARAVEVDFKLKLIEQSASDDDRQYSPLAAVFDRAGTLPPLANLNVYPDLSFGVASLDGVGPDASVHTQNFQLNRWLNVRFTSGTDAGCKVQVVIEDEDAKRTDATSAEMTTALDEAISQVVLGVFLQKTGTGLSTRCFDDVIVRKLDTCL